MASRSSSEGTAWQHWGCSSSTAPMGALHPAPRRAHSGGQPGRLRHPRPERGRDLPSGPPGPPGPRRRPVAGGHRNPPAHGAGGWPRPGEAGGRQRHRDGDDGQDVPSAGRLDVGLRHLPRRVPSRPTPNASWARPTRQLEELLVVDELTGLSNRRGLILGTTQLLQLADQRPERSGPRRRHTRDNQVERAAQPRGRGRRLAGRRPRPAGGLPAIRRRGAPRGTRTLAAVALDMHQGDRAGVANRMAERLTHTETVRFVAGPSTSASAGPRGAPATRPPWRTSSTSPIGPSARPRPPARRRVRQRVGTGRASASAHPYVTGPSGSVLPGRPELALHKGDQPTSDSGNSVD